MRRSLVLLIIAAAFCAGSPAAQTRDDQRGEYRTSVVQKGVIRIEDNRGTPPCNAMYLIEGKEKTLLIDTGMGKGDLARAGDIQAAVRRHIDPSQLSYFRAGDFQKANITW